MTSGFRIAALLLFAALAASAAAAQSASANWFVGGSELAAGKSAALASLANGGLLLRFINSGTPFIVACGGPIHTSGGFIQSGNTAKATSIVFLGCENVTPATCKLASAEIKSKPIKATAALGASSPADRLTFSPQTGKELATLTFEAGACAIEEAAIKGSVTMGAPKGQNEEVEQVLEGLGSVENNSLEVGANKAFLQDCPVPPLVALASGSKWGFK
jgi:hypothetical protein